MMQLISKNYVVTLDNSNARAEITFGSSYAEGGKWTGRVDIHPTDIGTYATRREAQQALAAALRTLADKVMADPVDPSE